MLDVGLHPRAVGREQVDGHAPHFPDEAGLSALGSQLDLVHELLGLAGPTIGIAHRPPQVLRRLARVDQSCARSREGDLHTELSSLRKLAFYLAVPAGESIGLGDCSPEVVDPRVEAIFHPHDALAVGGMESPENGSVASHPCLLCSWPS